MVCDLDAFHHSIAPNLTSSGFSDRDIDQSKPLLYGPENEPLGIEISHTDHDSSPAVFDEDIYYIQDEIRKILERQDAILIHGLRLLNFRTNTVQHLTSSRSIFYHGDETRNNPFRGFYSPRGCSRESHLLAEQRMVWDTIRSNAEITEDPNFRAVMDQPASDSWKRMVRFQERIKHNRDLIDHYNRSINSVLGSQHYREIRYASKGSQLLILRLQPGRLVHAKIPNSAEDPDGSFYAQDFSD